MNFLAALIGLLAMAGVMIRAARKAMITPVSKSNAVKLLKKRRREKNWTWDGYLFGYPDSDDEQGPARNGDDSKVSNQMTQVDAPAMTDDERQLLRD